jgi:hypothetical protein
MNWQQQRQMEAQQQVLLAHWRADVAAAVLRHQAVPTA